MNSSPEADSNTTPRKRLFGLLNPETFAPFAHRDFRVLWLSIFLRSAALWLEMVARPVLIVEPTNSLGPRFGLLTMGACLLGCALLALSTPRVRWWLWRRQMYVDVSKEDWLQVSDSDR